MLNWLKKIFGASKPATTSQATQATNHLRNQINNQSAATTASHSTTIKTAPVMSSKTNPPATGLRTAKLIMVTANNNNKYYEMKENNDGTFSVVYGRVGGKGSKGTYPVSQWNKKYNEKVRKGYKDQTHLFAETAEDTIEFEDISDELVEALIKELMAFAKKSISNNYNVTADQVTKKQVDQAQKLLDSLVKKTKMKMDVSAYNKILLDLFQVIPRKMSKVNDHLIELPKTRQEVTAIKQMLAEEQATLDVMRGQVEMNEKQKTATEKKEKINLLQAMGLEVESVKDKKTIKSIKELMQDKSDKFKQAYKVTNIRSQAEFDKFIKTVKNDKLELFWHGSRNENWMSIMETGLVLRPANAVITGKMFGYGLYFADKFQKSLNYTSLRGSYWANGTANKGYLALYDVHVGEQLNIQKHQSWCYELNEKKLKARGAQYDSLFAKGGADLINNEYIIYKQQQCTIRYLVEVTN